MTVVGISLVVALLVGGCEDPFANAISVPSPNAEKRGSFGWSTAGLDDVNGDGIPDLAVGAPGESIKARPFGGRVYLVSGRDGSILGSITSSSPQTKGFFGATVAGIGDVDGDETGDLVVGAHRETAQEVETAGRVYLCSGADGTVLEILSSPTPEEQGFFGSSVGGLGDVNGDGVPDLVVGASDESARETARAGRAYVVSGADGTVLETLASPDPEEKGSFGTSVSGVGDVSGDGVPDLVAGARHESGEGRADAGRAYLLSGAAGTVLETLTSPNAQAGGIFGGSVAGIDDVNGDGVPEVVVGAHHESVDDERRAGRAYLLSGADGTALQTFVSPNTASTGLFGESIAVSGDADGDGRPDVLVGAYGESARGAFGAGRAYLFSSADGQVIKAFASPNAEEEGAFGGAVAGTSTLGEAETPRILVGAFWESIEAEREGRGYLFGSEP